MQCRSMVDRVNHGTGGCKKCNLQKIICIEFDGQQHFNKMGYDKNGINLNRIKNNDNIKDYYCINNNIKLIRIRYDDNILKRLKDIIK